MHIGRQCTLAANVLMCQCAGRCMRRAPIRTETMHNDTIAALRLLVLALEAHPEDIETLTDYGDLPEHLVDVIDDYCDE